MTKNREIKLIVTEKVGLLQSEGLNKRNGCYSPHKPYRVLLKEFHHHHHHQHYLKRCEFLSNKGHKLNNIECRPCPPTCFDRDGYSVVFNSSIKENSIL